MSICNRLGYDRTKCLYISYMIKPGFMPLIYPFHLLSLVSLFLKITYTSSRVCATQRERGLKVIHSSIDCCLHRFSIDPHCSETNPFPPVRTPWSLINPSKHPFIAHALLTLVDFSPFAPCRIFPERLGVLTFSGSLLLL